MSNQIRISAKNLGALAMPDFCPRCFWLKLRMENKLPFQIFPGIFSSIDLYTKNIVHGWFDNHGCCPSWLSELGEIKGYINPPHYSKFKIVDKEKTEIRWQSEWFGKFDLGDIIGYSLIPNKPKKKKEEPTPDFDEPERLIRARLQEAPSPSSVFALPPPERKNVIGCAPFGGHVSDVCHLLIPIV